MKIHGPNTPTTPCEPPLTALIETSEIPKKIRAPSDSQG